ncbi:Cellobiose dehydrogenase [Cercospora zeina]
MKFIQLTTAALTFVVSSVAQSFSSYTDEDGVVLWQNTFNPRVGTGDAQIGLALPPASAEELENEYIGRIVAPIPTGGTWFGLTHTSGMTGCLILVVWPNEDQVITSFRYATGYVEPDLYTGDAALTTINSFVNSTHFGLTYRCKNCWTWDQGGETGSAVPPTTSDAFQMLGWAQGGAAPTNPEATSAAIAQHAQANIMAAEVASARNTGYTSWTSLGTPTTSAPSSSQTSATATTTAAPAPSCTSDLTVTNRTWDYIVVGSGAGGIPVADRLSESGGSVLLIEKGPPSTARWGGKLKPDWLEGQELTRFDVPGLDNQIWVDSAGIACADVSVMAGCVLGGGTAVNAGLWWKPNPSDFDANFPNGWKSSDMQGAVERTFQRIPFTDVPSQDGKIYRGEGYHVVAGALAASGWKNVTAGNAPAQKNSTFSRPNHMFSKGERGGPLATYLVSASQRQNFKVITGTSVNRVIRQGGRITGVEVDAFLQGGLCGQIKARAVVLSAGAFGTPKVLFRSGIGPQAQLETVSDAEGDKMIESADWIKLPVGRNLDDHTSTDIVITHPNITAYDFYGAYNNPIPADADLYLNSRSGILAQSAPNLITMFWEEITGTDGITRQLHYSARVESSHDIEGNNTVSITQYLGRGSTKRGVATITKALNMVVSEVPYPSDGENLAAIKTSIQHVLAAFAKDPSIKVAYPSSETTIDAWLGSYPLTTSSRSANHWVGTAKMGSDSGLTGGTSVVDVNTKVYGTDNLFVVDASLFPGMVTANPSAVIVSVAEQAAAKILGVGLPTGTPGGDTVYAIGSYQQCGGTGWAGATACGTGWKCQTWNEYYFQCIPQ